MFESMKTKAKLLEETLESVQEQIDTNFQSTNPTDLQKARDSLKQTQQDKLQLQADMKLLLKQLNDEFDKSKSELKEGQEIYRDVKKNVKEMSTDIKQDLSDDEEEKKKVIKVPEIKFPTNKDEGELFLEKLMQQIKEEEKSKLPAEPSKSAQDVMLENLVKGLSNVDTN